MIARKILLALVLLSAIGLLGRARYGGQTGQPGMTRIEPVTLGSRQLPSDIKPLKIEPLPTKVELEAAEIQASLNLQPPPMAVEPLKIERFSAPVQPLSAEIKPLKIEPSITTIGTPTFTAPRIAEPMTVVESPLPKQTQLPGGDFSDAREQRERTRELEQSLRQWNELKQMPKRLEQMRGPVGIPPVTHIPRRP